MMQLALLVGACMVLLSTVAGGQEAARDPVEVSLVQQWQAAQVGQQNVADALTKLLDAYRREKARADAAEAKLREGAPK